MRHARIPRRALLARVLALLLGLAPSLAPETAMAQVALPFSQNDVLLGSPSSEVAYTVDLFTLPARGELIAEAIPDDAHLDMSLVVEISGCTLVNSLGSCPASRTSPPGTGPRTAVYEAYACIVPNANNSNYVGKTCRVSVRATSFGQAGPPATFDLAIRGETEVPWSTVVGSVSTNLQTIEIAPTKDTTLYEGNPTSSNGLGESIWSRRQAGFSLLHGLIAFDVDAALPVGASIVDARLQLTALGTSTPSAIVDLHALARNPVVEWAEGPADAPEDESTSPFPAFFAATWLHRVWSVLPQGPWTDPGGDLAGRRIASARVEKPGKVVFDGAAFVDHVKDLAAQPSIADGLVLLPVDGGVRFASDEHPNAAIRPRLVVDYLPPPPPISANIPTATAPFINEGTNFRWIYDLDHDDVLFTPVVGRCEITNTGGTLLPYTYQFQGNPAYQGLDCCTWQIDSSTGVTGTGQALFYVNVDAANPANAPGDADVDGIKDLCDNCGNVPNGPLLGSCVGGSKAGLLCRSNQRCPGGVCSLAQDDQNLDGVGNVCVPEPGIEVGVFGGGLLLVTLFGASVRRRSAVRTAQAGESACARSW